MKNGDDYELIHDHNFRICTKRKKNPENDKEAYDEMIKRAEKHNKDPAKIFYKVIRK